MRSTACEHAEVMGTEVGFRTQNLLAVTMRGWRDGGQTRRRHDSTGGAGLRPDGRQQEDGGSGKTGGSGKMVEGALPLADPVVAAPDLGRPGLGLVLAGGVG
jgi:hypothetical protein